MIRKNGLARLALIVSLAIGVPTALIWPSGMASGLVTHFQQVAANSKWIQLVEYKVLDQIKTERKLTFKEWVVWCDLGIKLGFFKICPPR